MSERSGVEIDYCPKCRGVWLDRGELDKIIDKAAANESLSSGGPSNEYYGNDRDRDKYGNPYNQKYRKKRGFLGDMFDFD
jgi:Zn-finger nucleic acid-binding protein